MEILKERLFIRFFIITEESISLEIERTLSKCFPFNSLENVTDLGFFCQVFKENKDKLIRVDSLKLLGKFK